MGSSEQSITLALPPEEALQRCTLGLTQAGFKDVSPHGTTGLITAQKKAFGQWTKSQIAITVKANGSGSSITVVSQASAQSLSSLASDPAQRLVRDAVGAIEAAGKRDQPPGQPS